MVRPSRSGYADGRYCSVVHTSAPISARCGRMTAMDQGFGIDFGGSGIKGAPVDLEHGEFAAERVRIKTPEQSTRRRCADVR